MNWLVCSQCYHLSADVCQKERKGTSTASVLYPQSTCHTNTVSFKHTSTQMHTHMTTIIKCREAVPGEKKGRRRQWMGEKEKWRKAERSRERGMEGKRESCVLNIPCLILLCPRLSSSSWLAISGAEIERAPDKDNKDSLLHNHCSFISLYKVCHLQNTCCPNH